MRKLLITILLLAAVLGGIAVYLFTTTPSRSAGVRFPLTAAQRALVAQVPSSAESFALIPTAAAFEAKLRANPVTRDAIASFEEKQSLPAPWMLGGADLLVWRESGGGTRYLVHTDPLRSLFVRNEPPGSPMDSADLDAILVLAASLPPGDAFVVQRAQSRGAFPPIARPAVTSVAVTPNAIELTSRAQLATRNVQRATSTSFPRAALLAATFTEMPRAAEDLNRLFGTKVSALLENGGSIAIYDVETRKLLPRPLGVIAIPADDARRAAFAAFVDRAREAEALGVRVRTAEKDGQILLSFDDSLDTYLKDAFEPARLPGNVWSLRADPQRLAPILRKLGDSLGLRVAAPRLFRSARDLEHWIGGLERASAIEAAASDDGAAEVLRVRITAK
ncbi:MAG: hypothetical protein AABO58_07970 [Acidobacteriota bacterium]